MAVAGLLCAVGVLLGIYRLPLSTDQNELFSPDVPFFRDYLDFVRKFPENDSAYVLVEPADAGKPGDPTRPVPPAARWAALADAIADRLRGLPRYVKAVHARVPSAALGDQGLLFESPADVPARRAEVERFLPMVRLWAEKPALLARSLGGSPAERFVAAMRLRKVGSAAGFDVGSDAETAPFVAAVLASWDRALADPKLPLTPGAGLPDLDALGVSTPRDLGYFYVPDESDKRRSVLLIQVYPTEDFTSSTALEEAIGAIRAATADVARGYPEFRVGVTGRPALEADEMRTSTADGTLSEIIALSAVFVGLVLFLRSARLALAAIVCLCVGIGLTFGWASVSVGRRNVLSDVFLIALIGIGMDYFVQSLSRYHVEAARGSQRGGGAAGETGDGCGRRRRDPRRVWVAVVRQVATPIITACCGAAGAFLVAVLTPFRGAAELGVIAGGGLLLCLACGFTVLPALLTVWRGWPAWTTQWGRRSASITPQGVPAALLPPPVLRGRAREGVDRRTASLPAPAPTLTLPRRTGGGNQGPSPTLASSIVAPAARSNLRLLVTPVLWLLALAALLPAALRTRFDPGLLNLQAPDVESVQLVGKLQTWSAVVLSKDLAVLRQARRALAGSPEIAGTESLLDAADNAEWLRAHADSLRAIRWAEPDGPIAANLTALVTAVRALGDQFAAGGGAEAAATAAAARSAAGRIDAAVAAGRSADAAARLAAWQSAFVAQLRGMLVQFDPPAHVAADGADSPRETGAATLPSSRPSTRGDMVAEATTPGGAGSTHPAPDALDGIDPARLPPELRTHLVSADGTYALYLYPSHDLWQREHLERFVGDIESRLSTVPGAPTPTGIAVNIRHSTSRIQASFLQATAYALGLIVLLVWLDLRRPGQTLLAVSVLAFGLPMLAGLMGLLGVAWNLANFFGLPILIGAGHEYGVFMVHRYREAARDPARRAWGRWDASDWALLLCAYVTSASFGFFWLIARHQGLKSLGLVMALGTACVYLATVAVLRPVLKWKLGAVGRGERGTGVSDAPEPAPST